MKKRIPLLHSISDVLARQSVPFQIKILLAISGLLYTLVLFLFCYRTSPALFLYLTGGFWLLIFFYILISGYFFSKSFIRSSGSLKKTMALMAGSDLSAKAEVKGCKEIRELAASLNNSLEGIKLYIAKINRQADVLNSVSINLREGSDKNHEASKIVEQAMKELSDGASQQSVHLISTAESLKDLSILIRKVTDDAADIAVNSLSLSEFAASGQKISSEMDNQISRIFDSTQDISRAVLQLSENLEQVANITADIEDISEQTNLLSLNAAIEAARAGEHGLGFAVVASETAKLSHRSMEATTVTKKIIEQMIRKSREVNTIIAAGIEQSEKGKKLSADAQEKFHTIFSTLNESLKQIGGIADSATVIAEKSEAVSNTVSTIAAFGKQILGSTEHVMTVSEDQIRYTRHVADLSIELTESADILKKSITIDLSLTYFGNEKRIEATKKALELYLKSNPYIRFKADDIFMNGKVFFPVLKKRLADRILPDIVQLDQPWLPGLLDQDDYFVNLLTEPTIDLSGFEKSSLDMCTVNGNLMGLPTGINSICLMYGQNFFEKHGISTDTVWNWSSLLETGADIARKDSKSCLLYANYEFSHYLFKIYVRQKTGKQFILDDFSPGFDTDRLKDAFRYFGELCKSGAMFTTDLYGVHDKGILPHNQDLKPLDMSFGMIFNWVSDYDRNSKGVFPGSSVFMTTPPIAPDAKTSAIIIKPQLVLAVNKQSANVREATKFLNWIYNDPEGIKAWGTSRGPSPTKEGVRVQTETGMVRPVISDALEKAVKNGGSSENPLSIHGSITDLFTAVRKKMYAGDISPEKAADQTMVKLNKMLRKMKKAVGKNKRH